MEETPAEAARYVLGIDIGGTFTDLVLMDRNSGEIVTGKVLTTPEDYSAGVLAGMSDLLARKRIGSSQIDHVVHGTTLVINALIERKGARTALLVTKGFRDVLRLRREMRYDIFDIHAKMAIPLVPARHTFEVTERVEASGRVFEGMNTAELEEIASKLGAAQFEAVAICFLHSYSNPTHEAVAEDLLRTRLPRAAVSASHRVLAEWREYDRACATAINAYTQPITRKYIQRLDAGLRGSGLQGDWYVIAGNGGIVTPAVAAEHPLRILESGPVGGALAAAHVGERRGTRNLLAFDMGGTTAKISMIKNGKPLTTKEYEVARVERLKRGSGLPVRVPVIDMIEIGAGGGSIGRIDEVGLISVGPESAGASPGPACYGRGGTNPTVTDANLVLGLLDPAYFLGGEMSLDEGRAEDALATLGERTGLSVLATAWAMHSVVTANMAEAVRAYGAEQNLDYRKVDLVAFGGAGPAHAYLLARTLKIPRVIFPEAAGVFSAFGFLTTPLGFDFSRTHVRRVDRLDLTEVINIYNDMRIQADAVFADAKLRPEDLQLVHTVDMRYHGQGYELEVALPPTYLDTGDASLLVDAFVQVYREKYGRSLEGAIVEVVNWRLVIVGPAPQIRRRPLPEVSQMPREKRRRDVLVSMEDGFHPCPIYERYALRPDQRIEGPALVEERECTAFIGPGATATVDQFQNVVMELGS